MFYLQLQLPRDQENRSGFAAEPGCCFLGIASHLGRLGLEVQPILPFYIPLLTENVPPRNTWYSSLPHRRSTPPHKTRWKITCLGEAEDLKLLKWFRNAQPCPQGLFVFWYACCREAPGNEGWGILGNHSYRAMNFLPEGLPRLQAT